MLHILGGFPPALPKQVAETFPHRGVKKRFEMLGKLRRIHVIRPDSFFLRAASAGASDKLCEMYLGEVLYIINVQVYADLSGQVFVERFKIPACPRPLGEDDETDFPVLLGCVGKLL